MKKRPVTYKKGEKPQPDKCEKCGKPDWCRWIIPEHGWLCYECKCKVDKP